jgi:hypothetical protein
MRILLYCLTTLAIILLQTDLSGQSSWQRDTESQTVPKLVTFSASNAINLPTATTLQQGDFLYGIQHRWRQPTSDGLEELYGIDGSVVMRMKLGYAITDDILVQIARTNEFGTYDLELKHNFLNIDSDDIPLAFAYNAGGAYLAKNDLTTAGHMQAYLSLIANTMLFDKTLGLGVIGSGLYNANPFWFENITTANIGWYAQFYIDDVWSINAEGSHVINGWSEGYDTYSGSLEMEVGGHFFKFIVSNNTNIHLAGIFDNAPRPLSFNSDTWSLDNVHLGFQILRNL